MKITLSRPKQSADSARAYLVKADGRLAAYLRAGETKEIVIPDGARAITAHMDWAKSNALDATRLYPGAKIRVSNRIADAAWAPFLAMIAFLVAPQNYLKLEILSQGAPS
ncbi:MAG: hypothetical protein GC153_02065 [Alphaproteobacteria bacterium]|nr:hypothetical protein [Alphaproteobacteria bacterium]